MIDVHCHVLPGMDDGAADMEESIHMLRMAWEQGIHSVIATPHYSSAFRNERRSLIIEACRGLEQEAQEKIDADFRVYPGLEYLYSQGMLEKAENGRLLTLAESGYVLVEFLPSVSWKEMYRAVRTLQHCSYHPVIAHVERYRAVRENDRAEELLEAGCLLQMNYGPVGGKWLEERTRWCRKMLLEGNIHFLGTDMHNAEDRSPRITEAVRWMDKHLDEDYVEEICKGNAERLLLKKS